MTPIFEKIEQITTETLKKFGISEIPIPIEEIASKLDIKISREPSNDFSGILIRKDGKALIGVNSNEVPVRQRFTIAHELGHFFLHQQKDTFVDYRDNKKDVMRTPREKEANMFAAALLMPKEPLIKELKNVAKNGFSEEELKLLAEKFDVSLDSMKIRLMQLHL